MGWIKLHRDIQNHWLWEDKPFSKAQAWIDLLLLATSEDETAKTSKGTRFLKRGQAVVGIDYLARRWGWKPGKVRYYMTVLERTAMITAERKAYIGTLITICNYDKYQDLPQRQQQRQQQGEQQGEQQRQQQFSRRKTKEERSSNSATNRFAWMDEWAAEGDDNDDNDQN